MKKILAVLFVLSLYVNASSNIAVVQNTYKDAHPTAGDQIRYHIFIKNTGDVPLHDIKISNIQLGINDYAINDLGVGEKATVTHYEIPALLYTIRNEDVEVGEIMTYAYVTALNDNNDTVSDISHRFSLMYDEVEHIQIYQENPAHANIGFLKQGNLVSEDVIEYEYTIKNTGIYPLYDIVIEDIFLNLENYPVASFLEVNQTIRLTSQNITNLKYKLNSTEIALGSIKSYAKVSCVSYAANTEYHFGTFSDPSNYDDNQFTVINTKYVDSSFLPAIYHIILF